MIGWLVESYSFHFNYEKSEVTYKKPNAYFMSSYRIFSDKIKTIQSNTFVDYKSIVIDANEITSSL